MTKIILKVQFWVNGWYKDVTQGSRITKDVDQGQMITKIMTTWKHGSRSKDD